MSRCSRAPFLQPMTVVGLMFVVGSANSIDAAQAKPKKCREGMTMGAGQSCRASARGPVMHVLSDGIEFRVGDEACVRFRRDGKIQKFDLKVKASAIHNERGRLEVSDLTCGRLRPVTVKSSWMWDSVVVSEVGKGRMVSRFKNHRRLRIEREPELEGAAPGG